MSEPAQVTVEIMLAAAGLTVSPTELDIVAGSYPIFRASIGGVEVETDQEDRTPSDQ